MGHRNSPAQLGFDGRHLEAYRRTDQVLAALASERETYIPPAAKSLASRLLLLFVRFYVVFFSPILGGACKFHPSCSNYAREAIAVHGARRGGVLALKRLGHCRPFTRGGFDPVPDVAEFAGHKSAGLGMREGAR